jgi:hypothetical protein
VGFNLNSISYSFGETDAGRDFFFSFLLRKKERKKERKENKKSHSGGNGKGQ